MVTPDHKPSRSQSEAPVRIDSKGFGGNNAPMADRKPSKPVTVAPGVRLPASALRFTFARSGGPGGQHANKTSTRATLSVPADALHAAMPEDAMRRLAEHAGSRWTGEQLILTAAASRSQHANRRACLAKLRELLVIAMHRPRPRRPTRPSRGAKERRLDTKRQRGQRKSARRIDRDALDT